MYNIANVGWQLVHYTVYGTKKSNNDAFLRPVNCIVDSPASNICIVWRAQHTSLWMETDVHAGRTLVGVARRGIIYEMATRK